MVELVLFLATFCVCSYFIESVSFGFSLCLESILSCFDSIFLSSSFQPVFANFWLKRGRKVVVGLGLSQVLLLVVYNTLGGA